MAVREQLMVCPRCGYRVVFRWNGRKPQHPVCSRCRIRMKGASGILSGMNSSGRRQTAKGPKSVRRRSLAPKDSILGILQRLGR